MFKFTQINIVHYRKLIQSNIDKNWNFFCSSSCCGTSKFVKPLGSSSNGSQITSVKLNVPSSGVKGKA